MKNKGLKSIYGNRYVFISFFAAVGTMLVIFLCTRVFPFGGNTVLRMDLYHQYGPLFAELYDRFFERASLQYSWISGLGSCFLGNYFNYLSSPIGAIVVFFGHKHVPEAIACMIVIKAGLSSGTFAYYLKRSQKSQSPATVAFSLMYAFCAYMLAYYWNVMWLDAMVLLPIILLGIERILDHGKIGTYTAALALTLFSNYYMSFMLCGVSVIYFFYYCIIGSKNGGVINLKYKRLNKGLFAKLNNSRFFHGGVLFATGSLLAAGIMAFALVPTYLVLQSCSATNDAFPDKAKIYFTFFDFFANHLGHLETTIRSSGDDVLPNVYCGIITIILAVLYFFTKSISKKEKVATLGLLSVLFLSFNINFFNFIWHGFHFPNDLPYRFSFVYSFVLLVMAYKTFVRLKEFSTRQIAVSAAALIFFAIIVEDVKSKNVDTATIYISIVFAVIYVLLMTVLKDKRFQAGSIAVLMCICVCSEIIICDVRSFPNNITMESYESDYDDFRTIKEQLDKASDEKFYRMELSSLRTRMDNSWFGYNGVSVFSSMAYEKLAKLEDHLGLMSNRINSYTYNPQTPVYNMMHSLKYVVNNSSPSVLVSKYYKELDTVGSFVAYENNFNLPIAYCVSKELENWDFQPDTYTPNPFEIQNDYFEKACGEAEVFKPVEFSYVNYINTATFTEPLDQGDFFYEKNTYDTDSSVNFHVKTTEPGNYYMYYYVEGAESKDINVNSKIGIKTYKANQDTLVDLGAYLKDEEITISVPFEKNSGSMKLYVCRLDDKIFESGYDKLSKNTLQIESFEDTKIAGSFVADTDCILYTSIPYDKGWKVTLDGNEVDEDSILKLGDALLGIKVEQGEHSITFNFETQGLKIGIYISAASVLFALLLLLISSLKKHSKKKRAPLYKPVSNFVDYSVYYGCDEFEFEDISSIIEDVSLSNGYHDPIKERIAPPEYHREIVKEIIKPDENASISPSTITQSEWDRIFDDEDKK